MLAAGAPAAVAAPSTPDASVAAVAASGASASAAVPAAAAAARPLAHAAAGVPGPTARVAWTARLVADAVVRAAPGVSARRVGTVAAIAPWNGGGVALLVLESARDGRGRLWLRVRLPGRPNDAAGWIAADVARLARARWRVVVDVAARRASAFHDGRRVRVWPVVVGLPATETPRGLFAVYERVRQPRGSELGTWALHLTAHSDVLFDFGGGPGRVALHGRAGALLDAPLGSAASHGCVRMDDAVISWLAARAGPGTPVEIV
jgi:lipoprotein-anchoring transpeptidase ErfK/SrfK